MATEYPSGREEARIRGIVVQILRGVLDRDGLQGVMLSGPACPEGRLLERWLAREFPLRGPAQDPDDQRGTDRSAGNPDPHAPASTHLLVVHPAHKLWLLMDPPAGGCFPLGDVWPREIRRFAGGATVPPSLSHLAPAVVDQVETALETGLDGGMGCRKTLSALDDQVRDLVETGLARSRRRLRPPLVPKLTAWTPGIDPSH